MPIMPFGRLPDVIRAFLPRSSIKTNPLTRIGNFANVEPSHRLLTCTHKWRFTHGTDET
jgi:hypothetical protein